MCSDDLDSYANGSVATHRAAHAGHVKSNDPGKMGYPGHPVWGLGCEVNNLTTIKKSYFSEA